MTKKFFFKKLAHAFFGSRIFPKFFGGKIKNFDIGFTRSKFWQPRQCSENI